MSWVHNCVKPESSPTPATSSEDREAAEWAQKHKSPQTFGNDRYYAAQDGFLAGLRRGREKIEALERRNNELCEGKVADLKEITRLQGEMEKTISLMAGVRLEESAARQEASRLREAADFALMTITHALALGYLGEGSTLGMAEDALEKLSTALAGKPKAAEGEGGDVRK